MRSIKEVFGEDEDEVIQKWEEKVERLEKLLLRAKIELAENNLSKASVHIGELQAFFLRNILESYVELKAYRKYMWTLETKG